MDHTRIMAWLCHQAFSGFVVFFASFSKLLILEVTVLLHPGFRAVPGAESPLWGWKWGSKKAKPFQMLFLSGSCSTAWKEKKKKKKKKKKTNTPLWLLLSHPLLFFFKSKNLSRCMWPYGADSYWVGNWMQYVICKLNKKKNLFTLLRQRIYILFKFNLFTGGYPFFFLSLL